MRSQITVQFIDHTSYADNDTQDIVGMVLPHKWGPVDAINSFNQSKFMEIYPEIATKEYAQAISCFKAGAGMMEIFRPKLGYTYLHNLLYLAKSIPAVPAVNATLNAEAFETAFDNFSTLSVSSFDQALEVLSSLRKSDMSKLGDLKTAVENLSNAIDENSGVSEAEEAFTQAKDACVNLTNKVPKADTPSDWAEGVIPSKNLENYFTNICSKVSSIKYTPKVEAVPASLTDSQWNSKFAAVPVIPEVPAVEASVSDTTWDSTYGSPVTVEGTPASLTDSQWNSDYANLAETGQSSFAAIKALLSESKQAEVQKLDDFNTAVVSLKEEISSQSDLQSAVELFNTAKEAALTVELPVADTASDWAGDTPDGKATEIVAYLTALKNDVSGVVYTAAVPDKNTFDTLLTTLSASKQTEVTKLKTFNDAIDALKAGLTGDSLDTLVQSFNSAKASVASMSLPVAGTASDWADNKAPSNAEELVQWYTSLKTEAASVIYTPAQEGSPEKKTFEEIVTLLSPEKQSEVNKFNSYNTSITALRSAIDGSGDLASLSASFESAKTVASSVVLPTSSASDWANGSVPSQSTEIISYFTELKNSVGGVVYTTPVQEEPAVFVYQDYINAFEGLTPVTDYSELLNTLSDSTREAMVIYSQLNASIEALSQAIAEGSDQTDECKAYEEDLVVAKNNTTSIPSEIPSDWVDGEINTDVIAYLQNLTSTLNYIQYTPYSAEIPEKGPTVTLSPFRQSSSKFQAPIGSNIQDQIMDICFKYPGDVPLDTTNLYTAVQIGYVDDIYTVTVQLLQGSGSSASVLYSYQGSFNDDEVVDGQSYGISRVLANKSPYLNATCYMNNEQVQQIISQQTDFIATCQYVPDPYVVDESALETAIVAAYAGPFASCSISKSTLLIPTYPNDNINSAVINAAATRMDCNAIIGYDTTGVWSVDAVKNYFNKFAKDKFTFAYAARSIETAGGKDFIGTAIGTIAGRFVAVANTATINQVPSSTMYGPFPGTLQSTFDENEVLELADSSINTVYSTADGPIIWGIRSRHPRRTSYFGKSNVMRVIARILNQTFPICLQYHHTPNTDRKKANIQNAIQSILDRLISSDDLRADSYCQCDKNNNPDSETNGGELLIIDMVIGFVNLIDQYLIRIHATDDTVEVVELTSAGAE